MKGRRYCPKCHKTYNIAKIEKVGYEPNSFLPKYFKFLINHDNLFIKVFSFLFNINTHLYLIFIFRVENKCDICESELIILADDKEDVINERSIQY